MQWHAVLGTCLSAAYLLIILTGLVWSYDWYRSGLTDLTKLVAVNKSQAIEVQLKPTVSANKTNEVANAEPDIEMVWKTFRAKVPTAIHGVAK